MTSHPALSASLRRHTPGEGTHRAALDRLLLIRSSEPTMPMPVIYQPTVCLIAQGRKHVAVGDRLIDYDAANLLIASVELPAAGTVTEASAAEPYLCAALEFDLAMLADLVVEHGGRIGAGEAPGGITVTPATPALVDAMTRLVGLLDTPEDMPTLAPLIEREILYRLLTGPAGAMMRHVGIADSRLSQIGRAIRWIRAHFTEPFAVERVAEEAGMSLSAFHEHFRSVTAMSPLRFRTQLRLIEARRLMVAIGLDAATAGFRVGYDSPSQFSRDYARAFGTPPARDAARLRALPDYAMVA